VKIVSIQIGPAAEIHAGGSTEWWDKPWRSGFIKQPTAQPVWLSYQGLKGDEQADRANHGGVDKAVCVYPLEHYAHWQTVLGVPQLPFGALGENFSTADLLEEHVCIGDVYSVGDDARVQVSQPRQPCWKLARRWRRKDLASQVEQSGWTGFYFRVIRHGWVQAGDALELLERRCPNWTIRRCNDVMHHQKQDADAARKLSECPLLSASWRDALWARTEGQES
jgi:MOSC domain-containing protein YiiM